MLGIDTESLFKSRLFDNPLVRGVLNFFGRHGNDMLLMNTISSLDYLFFYLSIWVFIAFPPFLVMDTVLTGLILLLRYEAIKEEVGGYLQRCIPITDTSPIPTKDSGVSYTKALRALCGLNPPDELFSEEEYRPSVKERVQDFVTRKNVTVSTLIFGLPLQKLPEPSTQDRQHFKPYGR